MTNTDIKIQAKINYLRRLLNLRVRLMKLVETVDIDIVSDNVVVTWNAKPGLIKKISFFESIEFPVTHLSKRIEHYKRKFRTEFKNRHTNLNKKAMTKFMTINETTEVKNKTSFEYVIDDEGGIPCIIKTEQTPEDFDNVMYLGYDVTYGDVFKAWEYGNSDLFYIFLGTKGAEFNDK